LPDTQSPSSPAAVGRLPIFQIVGFTGHRRLLDVAGAAHAIRGALESLTRRFPGEWIALSSIANGGDRVFVEQARALGLPWHAILPLPRAEFAKDFTPEEWAMVEAKLASADHVRTIGEAGDREESYLDCGIETVHEADVLLALWDGDPARGKGGTADVVQYARSINKPLLIVDANSHEVRRENWDRLIPRDPVLEDLNGLHDARGGSGGNPFAAPESVFLFQQKCDHYATYGAPQYRRLLVSMVVAHVFAALVGAAVVAYGLHLLALPWIELAGVSFALAAALVLRRKLHSHHSWVRCRLAAEFCRSALATWGLPRTVPLLKDLDLTGTRGLARALHVLHARSSAKSPMPIEAFKTIYLEKRIDDQIAYYDRQVSRALPLFRRLTAGFWIATVLAIASTAFYAVTRALNVPLPAWLAGTTYVYLPIALPALAAACISIISVNDLQRRVARYREMQYLLEASRAQVASCRTWTSLEHVVLKTERGLLREVIEWHSTRSFSESH
jgi:hypothetical protein